MERTVLPNPDDRSDQEKFVALTAYAREAMAAAGAPGMALGLWANGREYTTALGCLSSETANPVTPDTGFAVASITKTVTATALFRLIDQGKLRLDDRVQAYLPGFAVRDPRASHDVTLRHLLNHTGGWMGDFFINTGDDDLALSRYVERMAGLPQVTPLGSFYTYNNAAFNVAGRILELAAGKPYEIAVRELVLDPLGLAQTAFSPPELGERSFVRGHYLKDERLRIAPPWAPNRGEAPCGGLLSTVPDLLRYARFHLGDGCTSQGERLLSRAALRQMQTPTVYTGDGRWMGLNWFIQDLQHVRVLSHGGSSDGQDTLLWLAPWQGVALVALTNLNPGNRLCHQVATWVLDHYLGAVEVAPQTRPLPEPALAEYAGSYRIPPDEHVYQVSPDGAGLLLSATTADGIPNGETVLGSPGPIRLANFALDGFVLQGGPQAGQKMDFLRDTRGQIGWLRLGGQAAVRVR